MDGARFRNLGDRTPMACFETRHTSCWCDEPYGKTPDKDLLKQEDGLLFSSTYNACWFFSFYLRHRVLSSDHNKLIDKYR